MSHSSPQPDVPYRAQANRTIQTIADLHTVAEPAYDAGALDGSDPQADNERRAAFAALAVIAYGAATRSDGEPIETVLSDLMGDLQHLLDVLAQSGEDDEEMSSLEGLIERGSRHYEAEIRGEL